MLAMEIMNSPKAIFVTLCTTLSLLLISCSGDSAAQSSPAVTQENSIKASTPATTANNNSNEASATSTTMPTATAEATVTPASNSDGEKKEEPTQSATTTATPTATAIPFPLNRPYELVFTASEDFESFPSEQTASFAQTLGRNFEQAPIKSGVSAAVFDGTRLWSASLGIAKPNREMTTNTPMIIRSTSKTFLGALIMMQVEDGLYQLQDTIATLLSDHPDYALIDIPNVNTNVTVEQLLTMTSGMDDWSEQSDFQSRLAIMMDRNWKPANNLSKVPTKFVEPGTYHYSYTNSILLGIIAAHKGDKHLNDIYQEVFFEPLGITGGLLPEIEMPVATAVPYDDLSLYQAGVGFGPLNTGLMAQFYGKDPMISWAGAGIVSTPENIARWGYELFSPSGSAVSSTVRKKLIDAMQVPTDPGMTSLGMSKYGYYMGSGAVALKGGTEIEVYTHPGGGGGRTSWLYYSHELDVSISLLANSQMLHEPGWCGYRDYSFMTTGECIAAAIFGSFVD